MYYNKEFDEKFYYKGTLGAIYSKKKTIFRLWTPLADGVKVHIYDNNKSYEMKMGEFGQWEISLKGDLKNKEYNYLVNINGRINEVVDPYAYAVSVNGNRAVILDLNKESPKGWENDVKPELKSILDSVIYEIHVRDFSIDKSSGVSEKNRGKFLGLVEKPSIERLLDLGVTHVHLLPSFDYASVDEARDLGNQYNWGYDPKNYNALEGSYSTNPFDPTCRIKEFKEMILKLHEAGIRVIMDVVYNHTFTATNSLFDLAVPKYYYRTNKDGEFSNGSACGNEIASERSMVRKYIVDSIVHWVKDYHIDGFRFDLMGLHDIETMKEIRKVVDEIDKTIIIYGEGWAGSISPLKEEEAALKRNTIKYGHMQIAAFSDDIRDGVKGNVFIAKETGFVNGGKGFEETIKAGVVAFTAHDEIDYSKVLYSERNWANEPYQCITYASAHDNYTLYDKLQISIDKSIKNKEDALIKMNKLVVAIILTSQGIHFIHGGEDFLRTKKREDGTLVENSYNSSDFVNKIDWSRKEKYKDVFNYYKGLIELRNKYNEFRLESAKEINEKIKFIDVKEKNLVAYKIGEDILVIYNGNYNAANFEIEKGNWSVLVNGEKAGPDEIEHIKGGEIIIAGTSALVLRKLQ